MDGERLYALIVRAGAPPFLDYKTLRREPFWRLKEAIYHRLLERELSARWSAGLLAQKSSAQGWPTGKLHKELIEQTDLDARRALRDHGRVLLPWWEWPEVESAEATAKKQLKAEADQMIDAWFAVFEPDNPRAARFTASG